MTHCINYIGYNAAGGIGGCTAVPNCATCVCTADTRVRRGWPSSCSCVLTKCWLQARLSVIVGIHKGWTNITITQRFAVIFHVG